MKTTKAFILVSIINAIVLYTLAVINFATGRTADGIQDVLFALTDCLLTYTLWRQMRTDRLLRLTAVTLAHLITDLEKGVPATLTIRKPSDSDEDTDGNSEDNGEQEEENPEE